MRSIWAVNCNIKRGWSTLPRAIGGVGLLILPIEHTTCSINVVVQHFGVLPIRIIAVPTAQSCTKSNPLSFSTIWNLQEPTDTLLACISVGWLSYYDFELHLDYPTIPFPRHTREGLAFGKYLSKYRV